MTCCMMVLSRCVSMRMFLSLEKQKYDQDASR